MALKISGEGERGGPNMPGEQCVRELQALVAPKPLQGVLVRGHAGLVINELSLQRASKGDLGLS